MDGERVSPSSDDSSGGEASERPAFTYTKAFNEQFPYYLSIGMSAEEFWRGDVFLAKAYREAYRLREERMNQQLWLQGMYIYDALCDASPIFNPFAKQGTKPHPYPTQPYTIHPPTKKEEKVKEKEQMEKVKRMMDAYASRINKRKKEEVSTKNG